MKRITILLSLFCVSILWADTYLAIVDNLNEYARNFHTIEREKHHYFVLVDDNDIRTLSDLGLSVQILDKEPHTKEYFLVYPKGDDEYWRDHILRKKCTVKATFDRALLVQGSAESIHMAAESKVVLNKLDYTPMRFSSRRVAPPIDIPTKKDSTILSIVEAVETDTLRKRVKHLQDFGTRYATSPKNSDEVCPWLFQKLYDLGCDTVYYEEFSHRYGPNIVGVKKGKKDSSLTTYCMIGGHLDSYSKNPLNSAPGADDNASGTAAVLEAARVMKDYSFENTIKFTLWNAEEVGLEGSEAMAYKIANNGDAIIGGVINFDMIGRTTAEYDYLNVTGPPHIPGGEDIVKSFEANATLYTDLKFVTMLDSSNNKSDHASFWRNNIVALYGIQSARVVNDVMHTTVDTLDNPNGFNDSEFYTNVVKAGVATLSSLAKPLKGSTAVQKTSAVNEIKVQLLQNRLALKLPSLTSEEIRLRIFNVKGQSVLTKVVNAEKGDVSITLDDVLKVKAIYIAEISAATFSKRMKLMSQ